MTLLEECILALGGDSYVLSKNESEKVLKKFFSLIPLTPWCEWDWKNIINKKEINDIKKVTKYLTSKKCYIIWDNEQTPIIFCELSKVIKNIYDVTAVSTNTWLMSEDEKCFIEIYHETRIIAAFV